MAWLTPLATSGHRWLHIDLAAVPWTTWALILATAGMAVSTGAALILGRFIRARDEQVPRCPCGLTPDACPALSDPLPTSVPPAARHGEEADRG